MSEGSVNGGLFYFPSTQTVLARADLVPLHVAREEFHHYNNRREDVKQKTVVIQSLDQEYDKKVVMELTIHLPGDKMSATRNIGESIWTPVAVKPLEGVAVLSRRPIKRILKEIGVEIRYMYKLSELIASTQK